MAVRFFVAAACLWAGAAAAQTATTPAATAPAQAASGSGPHYLLTAPLYDGASGNPYDFSVSPVQSGPAGTVAVTSAAAPEAYSFVEFSRNIHGYVSAGVATHNGDNLSGGVNIPLVPGKADLTVSGGTGQQGGLPSYPGQKAGTVRYDAYQVTLHVHPSDDVDAYIGFSSARLSGPLYRGPVNGW